MYHLIHANVAQARSPLDDPTMESFMSRVDEIDRMAGRTPGFVSQPTPPDEGDVFSGDMLLNLSIWEGIDALHTFTYSDKHARALERRAEWFVQYEGPNYVLYWALEGHIPTEVEVRERLEHLREHGSTPFAFTFGEPFTVQEMLAYKREEDW